MKQLDSSALNKRFDRAPFVRKRGIQKESFLISKRVSSSNWSRVSGVRETATVAIGVGIVRAVRVIAIGESAVKSWVVVAVVVEVIQAGVSGWDVSSVRGVGTVGLWICLGVWLRHGVWLGLWECRGHSGEDNNESDHLSVHDGGEAEEIECIAEIRSMTE